MFWAFALSGTMLGASHSELHVLHAPALGAECCAKAEEVETLKG